jgi:hypothetical protein
VISVDTPVHPESGPAGFHPGACVRMVRGQPQRHGIHSPVPGRSVRHDTALMRQVGAEGETCLTPPRRGRAGDPGPLMVCEVWPGGNVS